MSEIVREQLEAILEALRRIPRRFAGINKAVDFVDSDEGWDKLDAICMILIAVGEGFKKVDKHSDGGLLRRYPQIDWKGVQRCTRCYRYQYRHVGSQPLVVGRAYRAEHARGFDTHPHH